MTTEGNRDEDKLSAASGPVAGSGPIVTEEPSDEAATVAEPNIPNIPEVPEVKPPRGGEYASFSARLFAFLIDSLLIELFTLAVTFAGAKAAGVDPCGCGKYEAFAAGFGYLLFVVYFAWFHSHGGQTAGKAIMKIKVVRLSGEEVSFWRAFLRAFGYYISMLPLCIGFLWALWDGKRQTWHDKLAGTMVLEE